MAIKRVDKGTGVKGNGTLGEMVEKGKKRNDYDGPLPSARWWDLKEEEIPGSVKATVEHIRRMQLAFEQQRQVCARLYGGMIPGSAFGASYDRLHTIHPSLTGRLTYNVIAIVADTLISKITKNKIRPMFLTQGGDYRQQRRAKKLTQFADGMAYECKMDERGPDNFRDALILNEGIVHVFEDPVTGRVVTERVMPSELYVDEVDGFYGCPTQMHRIKNIDRQRLLEAFPEKADAIRQCHISSRDELGGSYQYVADTVAVAESWHLPSGLDANGEPTKDGWHTIVIDNAVLLREPYRKKRFPFAVYRWKPSIYGWHGISLAQELIGSQVEMNHLLIMFQRAFRLMAAFRIAVENGTVPDQHFQDKIGTILHVPKGSMTPQFLTPPAMNDQYFEHFEKIKARAFEIARLSQLSAVGQKPAGLDSGEAQRVYHDIENEGFQYAGQQYEAWHMDVTALQIDVVRDIFEREGKYQLRAPVAAASMPGAKFLRTIDWGAVKLDEDEYILKCSPVSSLPSTPQGKLATIQDLIKAGFVDAQTGQRLLDFPDLQQVQTLMGAAEDWIMQQIDAMIDTGKAQIPDPYMNLAMASKLGIQEYSVGAANNMPEKTLELLRGWLGQVQRMSAMAQAAAAPPPQQGALQPGQGVPAPPPQSQLMPPAGTQMPQAAA